MEPLGIYIHWPFCRSKCPYCDFNSYEAGNIDYSQWLESYIWQLNYFLNKINSKKYHLNSIFFGGGTPSLMPVSMIESLICKISDFFDINNTEITIESNPFTESEKFKSLHKAGINRISIGVQSLNDTNLKWLGRTHSSDQAIKAIEEARKIFDNYSFDLMFGLKNQTPKQWSIELKEALKLSKNHISIYNLTIEQGTHFYKLQKVNKLHLPQCDAIEEMHEITKKIMHENNFHRYEVSNYSKMNNQSKHNMLYWKMNNYIGIGPGAFGRMLSCQSIIETTNVKNPKKWLEGIQNLKNKHINETPWSSESVNQKNLHKEIFMMGMRISEGINLIDLSEKFNLQIHPESPMMKKFITLQEEKLIKITDHRLIPTQRGIDYADGIVRFIFN